MAEVKTKRRQTAPRQDAQDSPKMVVAKETTNDGDGKSQDIQDSPRTGRPRRPQYGYMVARGLSNSRYMFTQVLFIESRNEKIVRM